MCSFLFFPHLSWDPSNHFYGFPYFSRHFLMLSFYFSYLRCPPKCSCLKLSNSLSLFSLANHDSFPCSADLFLTLSSTSANPMSSFSFACPLAMCLNVKSPAQHFLYIPFPLSIWLKINSPTQLLFYEHCPHTVKVRLSRWLIGVVSSSFILCHLIYFKCLIIICLYQQGVRSRTSQRELYLKDFQIVYISF